MSTLKEEYIENIDKLHISNSFLTRLANHYIKINKLDDAINQITYNDTIFTNGNFFNTNTRNVNIDIHYNLKDIISYSYLKNKIYNHIPLTNEDYDFIYSELVIYLYHELTHVKQYHMINVDGELSSVTYLLAKSYALRKQLPNVYVEHQALFPHEHHAISKSHILRNKFYTYMGINEEKYRYRNNVLIVSALLKDYTNDNGTIISPTEKLCDIIEDKELNDFIHQIEKDLYTRVLYGLPISKDEYYDFEPIFNKENDIRDVKQYIKR